MRLIFWRDPKPTRPGDLEGWLPHTIGRVVAKYTGCGHFMSVPSNIQVPEKCPHEQHEGWAER